METITELKKCLAVLDHIEATKKHRSQSALKITINLYRGELDTLRAAALGCMESIPVWSDKASVAHFLRAGRRFDRIVRAYDLH